MKKILLGAAMLAPFAASAQQLSNLQTLLNSIKNLVSLALPIVVGLALLGFFWGLMKFIFNAGDEGAKDEGKRIMIYGVIALFVMVAVWGLVGFIGSALGIETGGQADIPTVPGL
jgi:hypothetical protein